MSLNTIFYKKLIENINIMTYNHDLRTCVLMNYIIIKSLRKTAKIYNISKSIISVWYKRYIKHILNILLTTNETDIR